VFLALLVVLLIPGMALAAETGVVEPYGRLTLWLGAVAYAAFILIAITIAFRGRFNKRVGGTTVHDDLWRKYEEGGGPEE